MKRVERQSVSSPWEEAWLSLPGLVAIHRLGGRIVVNLLRKLFRHLVLVTSTGKHLWLTVWWRFLYQKEKKSTTRHACWERESLEGKKLLHWPQDLALPYFLGLVSYYKYSSFILSSSSETHSAGRSAPPWITWVVVRMILAWCYSLFEFKSSPLWLEMYVPSSTSIVNGFLYAFSICISK